VQTEAFAVSSRSRNSGGDKEARLFIGIDSGPSHWPNCGWTYGVILMVTTRVRRPHALFFQLVIMELVRMRTLSVLRVLQERFRLSSFLRLQKSECSPGFVAGHSSLVPHISDLLCVISGEDLSSWLRESRPSFSEVQKTHVKQIAIVVPQFPSRTRERRLVGEGFTDWSNAIKAKPRLKVIANRTAQSNLASMVRVPWK